MVLRNYSTLALRISLFFILFIILRVVQTDSTTRESQNPHNLFDWHNEPVHYRDEWKKDADNYREILIPSSTIMIENLLIDSDFVIDQVDYEEIDFENNYEQTSVFVIGNGIPQMSILFDDIPEISSVESFKLDCGKIILTIIGKGFGFDTEGLVITVSPIINTDDRQCSYPKSCLDYEAGNSFNCADIQLSNHAEQIDCIVDAELDSLPETMKVAVTTALRNPPVYAVFYWDTSN